MTAHRMVMHASTLLTVALLALATGVQPAGAARAPDVRAGVGQADITPPTGIPFGGWVRADRSGRGVHTRLNATAIVLERGGRKVALVSVDLFAAVGGMVKEAADRNADLGYSERNVMVSASHTHGGPSGYANFSTLNTLAPSIETIDRPNTFAEFINPRPVDRQLYTFLVDRIALAIRQADRTLAPARVGWGEARLTDVTKNRSLEAHLANHGLILEPGKGRPEQDSEGRLHTIDPEVNVLRVDRLVRRSRPCVRRGRRTRCRRTVAIPMGGWSMFANHGTVNPASYLYYNQDHHGAATRVFEREVRRIGRVPASRRVVNVYGNGNEGDQSAGLDGQGPVIAERVGRREAAAMLRAWRQAGRRMTRRPTLDVRWTRVCFCGQMTSQGPVGDTPVPGMPFLTGSEENRGPLFDLTGVPFEGHRSPTESGFKSQGHKIPVPGASTSTYPNAAPLFSIRVRDRLIVSLPGEPTVEVGRRVRARVLEAVRPANVRRVIVSGLTNEFLQYLTTPEEYDRQHYEGGSTMYGPNQSVLLTDHLAELSQHLVRGEPAQEAYEFDPRNGVTADAKPYGKGAERGTIVEQPRDGQRETQLVEFGWTGGTRGLDKPLDTPFITVERRRGTKWKRTTDDLWIDVRWQVDDDGRYTAQWMVPEGTAAGTYRFVVTANRYALTSRSFVLRG